MDTYGWVEQSFSAIEAGNFDYAEHASKRALETSITEDEQAEANYTRGYVAYIKEEHSLARDYLYKTIDIKEDAEIIDRRRVDALLIVVESLRRENNTETALELLEHCRDLLHIGSLPENYQGLVSMGFALCLKNSNLQQAREEAKVALAFFPDNTEMADLIDSREWEPTAWQILQTKEYGLLDSINWGEREGPRVKEYLQALQLEDTNLIDASRRNLRDSWWRKNSWWNAAVSKRQEPGRALEILKELEDEHHLDEEWKNVVKHYKAELLTKINPEEALKLVENDESEIGQTLAIAAAEAAGKKTVAARIKRKRGDWGAGARELLEESYEDLDKLVGLDSVKQTVKDWCDLVEVSRMRGDKPVPGHIVMTGNPGTGKTTVANIWSKLLWALDLTKDQKTNVVSRGDLVGEYIGHTAPLVKKVWEESKGGVLFIDEAYALAGDNFGAEAISTLLELMENEKEAVSVIIAGYATEIPKLWQVNPGFRSRFTRHLDFPDYNGEELAQIAMRMFESKKLVLEPAAQENLASVLGKLPHDENWANAREIRNWIDVLLVAQARRIIKTRADPRTILVSDCQQGLQEWWKSRG